MDTLKVGIIGAGMIARAFASALRQTDRARFVAIAGRRRERVESLVADFSGSTEGPRIFSDWRTLLNESDCDAVYIATPTGGREEIAMATLDSGRHLISEKPFFDLDSVTRLANRARERNLAFMDATHFSHHPRTEIIRTTAKSEIGRIQCVNSAFFFPLMDRTNIRFQQHSEPTGAIGDMGWYNMRAIVEYMQPGDTECSIHGSIRIDSETNTVIGGAGIVRFVDGRSATFDFGYDAGVCIQDATLLGESGMIQWPDLVLDNSGGFVFNNPAHKTGFAVRKGMQTRAQEVYVEAHSEKPQLVQLIENFAQMCGTGSDALREAAATRAIQTQRLVDALARSVLKPAKAD